MERVKKYIKDNKSLCILILIAFIIQIASLIYFKADYNISSDDLSYINSGINFKRTGIISMHSNFPSAQIMPGMTYLIGLVSFIFGEGKIFFVILKTIWMIMGLLSILGVYKIVNYLLKSSKYKNICSLVACIPLLFPEFVWQNNIILTETPFMCAFIWLIYFTFKEADKHSIKNFIMILILYMASTLLKANFAIYPCFLIGYLIFKKYNTKLLVKECIIAAFVMSLFFVPWTIRNYNIYHEFIPLTYGSGNPKLLGTYEGYGYPSDEEINFDAYLKNYGDKDIEKYLKGESEGKFATYYSMKIDGIHANYRIKKWWEKDKISFLVSYILFKPARLFMPFYWDKLFKIPRLAVTIVRIIELGAFALAFIILLKNKKISKEIIFLLINAIAQVVVYSTTFTFSRYGQPLMFILFIIIGLGLNQFIVRKTECQLTSNKKVTSRKLT